MPITVSNLNKKHKINEKFVKRIAADILKIIKSKRSEIEIVFLTDGAIKPINKRYKKSARSTDVLSFDLGERAQILISSDMALRNCRVFNTSFENELIIYVIHGILHLSGYDDENTKDRLKMFQKQDSIMERLCARIDLSKVLMPR